MKIKLPEDAMVRAGPGPGTGAAVVRRNTTVTPQYFKRASRDYAQTNCRWRDARI
jgi:hypothetical protein